MKKSSLFALLLAAISHFASPASAHAFGKPPSTPTSNGSNFPNQGTFSAVVRGMNLSGTVEFSTSGGAQPEEGATTGSGSSGSSQIYYNGTLLSGNAQGNYDPQASTMSVSFEADADGQGQRNYSLTAGALTSRVLTQRSTDGGVTFIDDPAPNPILTTTSTPLFLVRLFDCYYINGSAVCSVSKTQQTQNFKGEGNAQYQELHTPPNDVAPRVATTDLRISVSGTRISDNVVTFATATVRPPTSGVFQSFLNP
jgi:hypothetical protein